jgi:drug/metabolite transporter (DMT)-like permease
MRLTPAASWCTSSACTRGSARRSHAVRGGPVSPPHPVWYTFAVLPPLPYWGEILSITAALVWAVAVILFRQAGDRTSPLALNFFKNTVAVVLLVPTVLLSDLPLLPHRPAGDYLLLAGSALLGIALADTLFFAALRRLGAGLLAVVDTLYSPSVIVLSACFLGEKVGPPVLAGAGLVVGAVVVGAADRPPAGRTQRDIAVGVVFGALAMLFMAIGVVMIKRMLDTTPVLWASLVRLAAGGIGLMPWLAVRSARREILAILRPSRAWRFALPAAVLGSYLAMMAWIGGIKYAQTSVAAVLNQMSTIFIFLFAALLLKEPLTVRRSIAVAMAFAGAWLVVQH